MCCLQKSPAAVQRSCWSTFSCGPVVTHFNRVDIVHNPQAVWSVCCMYTLCMIYFPPYSRSIGHIDVPFWRSRRALLPRWILSMYVKWQSNIYRAVFNWLTWRSVLLLFIWRVTPLSMERCETSSESMLSRLSIGKRQRFGWDLSGLFLAGFECRHIPFLSSCGGEGSDFQMLLVS